MMRSQPAGGRHFDLIAKPAACRGGEYAQRAAQRPATSGCSRAESLRLDALRGAAGRLGGRPPPAVTARLSPALAGSGP